MSHEVKSKINDVFLFITWGKLLMYILIKVLHGYMIECMNVIRNLLQKNYYNSKAR